MPNQRWRYPVVLRVKSVVFAAIGTTVAAVFFPLWFAVPVVVLLDAWALGIAVLGAAVVIDPDAGILLLRMGLITRRIPISDVTAVLADHGKVSIARANGGEVSVYAWRKSRLDGWLRAPVVADDIGHAIASAVALAQDATAQEASPQGDERRTAPSSARTRSALATALLGGVGLVAIAAALLVRVHWPNQPVMTALGALLALALGVSGLFYLLFSLWLLLTRDAQRPARGVQRARRAAG